MANAIIIQRPNEGYDWLYEDRGEDWRYFTDVVCLAEGAPLWAECTNAEKEEWEREHPIPEPEYTDHL